MRTISLLGIPNDDNSSLLKGTAEAPALINSAGHASWSESCAPGHANCHDNFVQSLARAAIVTPRIPPPVNGENRTVKSISYDVIDRGRIHS
jgi:hypothetical protein